jgi:hypothetical protein
VTQDTSPGCLAALPPDAAARTLVAEGGRRRAWTVEWDPSREEKKDREPDCEILAVFRPVLVVRRCGPVPGGNPQ